jgi:hypothetical protein
MSSACAEALLGGAIIYVDENQPVGQYQDRESVLG